VGGFDCPANMRFRQDFARATVCSNRGFDGVDVPGDVCVRAFIPCLPMKPGCTAETCEPELSKVRWHAIWGPASKEAFAT
jgi:hypothetical protein